MLRCDGHAQLWLSSDSGSLWKSGRPLYGEGQWATTRPLGEMDTCFEAVEPQPNRGVGGGLRAAYAAPLFSPQSTVTGHLQSTVAELLLYLFFFLSFSFFFLVLLLLLFLEKEGGRTEISRFVFFLPSLLFSPS